MTGLQDGVASFCLHKVDIPHRSSQYQWSLSDSLGDFTDSLIVKHRCNFNSVAAIQRQDGSLLTSLHQGGFYTLNIFRWGSRMYRYVPFSVMDSALFRGSARLFSTSGWIPSPALAA